MEWPISDSGHIPPGQWDLPEVGDKIVMVHCQADSEILYLMRVLAKDDDCMDYISDCDTIIVKDDCTPYILSNVMGSIRIKRAGYPFLNGLDLKGFSAGEYLPADVSLGFKKLFDEFG